MAVFDGYLLCQLRHWYDLWCFVGVRGAVLGERTFRKFVHRWSKSPFFIQYNQCIHQHMHSPPHLPWFSDLISNHTLPLRGFAITLGHTTHGRTHLDKQSTRCKDLCLTNTQHSQETNIHGLCGIRTPIPTR